MTTTARRLEYAFWVRGEPATKGSWRAVRNRRTGKQVFKPDNPKEKPWHDLVAWTAKAASVRPISGPVAVRLHFVMKRPKDPSHYYPHRGDLDKLARSILDALSGIAYSDDAQVVSLVAEKRWGEPNESGVHISLAGVYA